MPILEQIRENYRTTGALLPSSPALARALTRPWRRTPGARRLLEVGPGAGAVTGVILKQLRPGDELTLVEINTDFVETLHHRFQNDPAWKRYYHRTQIVHAPIQNVASLAPFDFIVSGLTFSGMQPVLIEQIFATFERLLKPPGVLSYFEFRWLAEVRNFWSTPASVLQAEFSKLLLQKKIRRHQFREEEVLLSVPPTVVHHLSFPAREAAGKDRTNKYLGV